MKASYFKRLEMLERESCPSRIPREDKLIVITCTDGDEHKFNQLKQERISELRAKYGAVEENDFQIIHVRKFYQKTEKGLKDA